MHHDTCVIHPPTGTDTCTALQICKYDEVYLKVTTGQIEYRLVVAINAYNK